MIDSYENTNTARFLPFEGMWLATNPSGAVTCARVVNGKLLIPYSFGNPGKITGHYYDCRVLGGKLFCRFEHFDSALAGVMFLSIGQNHTLHGGRCATDLISEADQQDCSRWTESLPGIRPVIWVRILKMETPNWAKKYFLEDWSNKA
jgi:hypothetical protein